MNKLIPSVILLSGSFLLGGCVADTDVATGTTYTAATYPNYNVEYTYPAYNWGNSSVYYSPGYTYYNANPVLFNTGLFGTSYAYNYRRGYWNNGYRSAYWNRGYRGYRNVGYRGYRSVGYRGGFRGGYRGGFHGGFHGGRR